MTSTRLLFLLVPLFACAPPKLTTPIAEIPKLTSLEEVMDNQATAADPQFSKIGSSSYADTDFAAFVEVSNRIQATSLKVKDFSKGPEFDRFADRLHEQAIALGKAADAKDAKASSDALAGMKTVCKECHSKFK